MAKTSYIDPVTGMPSWYDPSLSLGMAQVPVQVAPTAVQFAPGTKTSTPTRSGFANTFLPSKNTIDPSVDPFGYQKQQQANQMRTGALTSIGAQALQTGLQLVPSPAQIYNRRRLAEIEQEKADLVSRIEAGDYGLSGEQRQLLTASALDPVAAQTREARMQQEAIAASSGNTASAASNITAQREAQRALRDSAMQAGLAIEQENLRQAAAQAQADQQTLAGLRQEEMMGQQARTAEQQQILSGIGTLASDTAALSGQFMGAKALEEMDFTGMSDQQKQLFLSMQAKSGKSSPDQLNTILLFQSLIASNQDEAEPVEGAG